jgi:ring-1,2-phenylacetyl-CoA epoxidase subunit PaaD
MVNLQQIEAILAEIPDPEIPVVSIRELGILRDIRQQGDEVEIVITPTYSGCPAMGQIEDDIRAALVGCGAQVRITRQLAPAWTTDWISLPAREKLRHYGIAPPHAASAAGNIIRFAPKMVAAYTHTERAGDPNDHVSCPHCGSSRTTETSHFSSTACKALYKCLDCQEPFDYFKPY